MKTKLSGVAALCALLSFSHAAQADTFTYVGNSFDTFSGVYACPSQCNFDISLTVLGPLTNYLAGPAYSPNTIIINTSDIINNPGSFTMTDGLYKVTDQTIAQQIASGYGNGINATFEFMINAAGQIDFSNGWIISVAFNPSPVVPGFGTQPQNYMSSISQGSGGLGTNGTIDQTYEYLYVNEQDPSEGTYLAGSASVTNAPGMWNATYTSPPTPLPAALPLFATGLGALGLLGWRRKRKNAAAIAA